MASCAQTVLPMLLCMPVLAQVEKFIKKVVPDMLSTVFVPFLTMLVMVPVDASPDNPSSIMLGTVASVIAFASAAAITYFFGFTKEQLEEDRKAAEAA